MYNIGVTKSKGDDFMKITIRVKDKIYLSQKIKDYAEEKLSKLDQYFKKSDELIANVLFKEYDEYKMVEVTIPTKNIILRAEVKEETFLNAIDAVLEKLESQIRKHKSKIYSSLKRREGLSQYYASQNDFDIEMMKTEILLNNLVKNKSVDLQPMIVDDAIMQMEMLDHKFYVFKNAENDKICVVYLRDDGNYGLIETN